MDGEERKQPEEVIGFSSLMVWESSRNSNCPVHFWLPSTALESAAALLPLFVVHSLPFTGNRQRPSLSAYRLSQGERYANRLSDATGALDSLQKR